MATSKVYVCNFVHLIQEYWQTTACFKHAIDCNLYTHSAHSTSVANVKLALWQKSLVRTNIQQHELLNKNIFTIYTNFPNQLWATFWLQIATYYIYIPHPKSCEIRLLAEETLAAGGAQQWHSACSSQFCLAECSSVVLMNRGASGNIGSTVTELVETSARACSQFTQVSSLRRHAKWSLTDLCSLEEVGDNLVVVLLPWLQVLATEPKQTQLTYLVKAMKFIQMQRVTGLTALLSRLESSQFYTRNNIIQVHSLHINTHNQQLFWRLNASDSAIWTLMHPASWRATNR